MNIWADELAFPEGAGFFFYMGEGPRTPFQVDAFGVHYAGRLVPRDSLGRPVVEDQKEGYLGIVTFDPDTGGVRRARRLDVFAPYLGRAGGPVEDFATAPDGTYGVIVGVANASRTVQWKLILGNFEGDTSRAIDLPWIPGARPHQLAWDGEAFVAHGFSLRLGGWEMSRIRTNGTLIGTTVQLPDPGNVLPPL
ncbi:MAG: hypothetical protein ACOYM9_24065 [Bradymonadia bacterium]